MFLIGRSVIWLLLTCSHPYPMAKVIRTFRRMLTVYSRIDAVLLGQSAPRLLHSLRIHVRCHCEIILVVQKQKIIYVISLQHH